MQQPIRQAGRGRRASVAAAPPSTARPPRTVVMGTGGAPTRARGSAVVLPAMPRPAAKPPWTIPGVITAAGARARAAAGRGVVLAAVRASATPPPATFWAAMEARVNASVAGLSAPLAFARTPEGTPLPYAEYARQGADGTWNTAGEATWDGRFDVTCYAATDAQADALALAISAALKDAPLAFTAGTLVYLRPALPDGAALDPDPGPDGEDVYSSMTTFRYMIHRA